MKIFLFYFLFKALDERLIDYGIKAIQLKPFLNHSFESTHLYQQLFRSATSVPLNYAESKAGESVKDFVHKMTICLKELHETQTNLKLLRESGLLTNANHANTLIQESNELISIFTKSIKTTKERYPEKFRNN